MYAQMMKEKIEEYLKDQNIITNSFDNNFELFVSSMIMNKYGCNSYLLKKGIVDGGRDEGIDSIYVVVNGEIIDNIDFLEEKIHTDTKIKFIFIQSKTKRKFEEDAVNRINIGIQLILGNKDNFENERLKDRAAIVRSAWKCWFKLTNRTDIEVEIYYATMANNASSVEDSEHFKVREEKIYEFLTGYDISYKKVKYMGCKELEHTFRKSNSYSKSLRYINSFKCNPKERENSEKGFIFLVSGKDYLDFITDEKGQIEDSIFEENIRDFQGADTGVNKAIKNTIVKNECNKFWCYNNGITIISDTGNRNDDYVSLSNYQIINGCQTSYSIYDAMNSLDEESKNNRDFELIIKVIVINSEKEDEIIKIIENTNSQTKIDNYAFESYRNVHKRIEEFMKTRGGKPYFYERRKGFYKRRNYPQDRILTPKELLQEFYAIYFKAPSHARNSASHVFDTYKSEVFKDEVYPDLFFICHEIGTQVRKHISSYDKLLDRRDSFMIQNMSLHFSRTIFSLLLGKEINIRKCMYDKEISKKLGIDLIDVLLDEKFDLTPYFDKAFTCLRLSFEITEKEYKNQDYTLIVRKADLDENITKVLAKHFKTNSFDEVIEDNKIAIRYENLRTLLNISERKFKKIYEDGDLRFNFYERVQDIISDVRYYYSDVDSEDLIESLNQIREKQDNAKNNYTNRKEFARQILEIIDQVNKNI